MKKLLSFLIAVAILSMPYAAHAFRGDEILDDAYSRSKWNGDRSNAASRNVLYDKIETITTSPTFTTDITIQGLTGANE